MRVFSHDQAHRFYLSPYAKVTVKQDSLIIHQTVFNSTALLKCSEKAASELLNMLSDGAEENMLLTFFESYAEGEADRILYSWIRAGVIE